MQVFKAYAKIVKTNMPIILVNLVIALGLAIVMSSQDPVGEVFTEERQRVCVIDSDGSFISRALTGHVAAAHDLVEVDEDLDKLQDAFYYRDVDYLIRIPAGFGASFEGDGEIRLEITAAPQAAGSVYVSSGLEAFLGTYRAYRMMGFDESGALGKTEEACAVDTQVSMAEERADNVNSPNFNGFFRLMPYAFISILVACIGFVMIAFNRVEVSKRMKCSSTASTKVSAAIVIGSAALALLVWLTFIIAVFVLYGTAPLEYDGLGYLIVNSLALLASSLGLAFLCGSIARNESLVSIFGVSLSMLCSFLSGVFVPLELISEKTQKISRCVPTYWYMKNCDRLYNTFVYNDSFRTDFAQGIYIQLAFAVAMIGVAFLIMKKRKA